MRRLAFGRPWRQTEGLSGTLMHLLGLDLSVPDHTTVDRRCPNLAVAPASASTEGPIVAVLDRTGPKVFGKGGDTRNILRHDTPQPEKTHLAADPDTGVGLASELTGIEDEVASVVVPLLDWIKRPVGTVLVESERDSQGRQSVIRFLIAMGRSECQRRCRSGKT